MYAMSYGRDHDATTLHDIRFEDLYVSMCELLYANTNIHPDFAYCKNAPGVAYHAWSDISGIIHARERYETDMLPKIIAKQQEDRD